MAPVQLLLEGSPEIFNTQSTTGPCLCDAALASVCPKEQTDFPVRGRFGLDRDVVNVLSKEVAGTLTQPSQPQSLALGSWKAKGEKCLAEPV